MTYLEEPLASEWACKPWRALATLRGLTVMIVLMGVWLARAASYHGWSWQDWLDEKFVVLSVLGTIITHLRTREREPGLDAPDASMRVLFQVAILLIMVLSMLIAQS